MGSSVVLATAGYDHTIRWTQCRIWFAPARLSIPTCGRPRRRCHCLLQRAEFTCPRLPCRFWEATSGICYRTLQYADSQVRLPRLFCLCCALQSCTARLNFVRFLPTPAVTGQQAGDYSRQDPHSGGWQPAHTVRSVWRRVNSVSGGRK